MGAPSNWTFTTATRTKILDGTLKTGDTYKMALFNSSWVTTTLTYSTTNELAGANGYTQGGVTVAGLGVSGTTTVTVTMTTAPGWTASGGSLVCRYAVIYDSTDAAKTILCYCLLDSAPADITTAAGNMLVVGSNGATIETLS